MFDPKTPRNPRVIAHRGGSLMRPENSYESFKYCADAGFEYVETDARLSSDGQVYLFHDLTLERVSDGKGKLSDYSSTELDELTIHGSQRGPLRLRNVLEDFPNLYLNIDAKTDDVVEPLLRVVQECAAVDRVLIASFSTSRLQRVRNICPDVATSLGQREIAALVVASQLPPAAALRYLRKTTKWLEPAGIAQLGDSLQPAGGAAGSSKPVAVQVPLSYRAIPIVTKRFVSLSHALGLHVHVWTLNEAKQIKQALAHGADAIITDDPPLAKAILKDRI
ncbi:MAG: glycerophosphodiester phosphodiesterase family protein [Actinomycetaceae bacterium]|nr:glycerophosphodiester phosphodiesterase family protein [Actinomycetaceae bacterium]